MKHLWFRIFRISVYSSFLVPKAKPNFVDFGVVDSDQWVFWTKILLLYPRYLKPRIEGKDQHATTAHVPKALKPLPPPLDLKNGLTQRYKYWYLWGLLSSFLICIFLGGGSSPLSLSLFIIYIILSTRSALYIHKKLHYNN